MMLSFTSMKSRPFGTARSGRRKAHERRLRPALRSSERRQRSGAPARSCTPLRRRRMIWARAGSAKPSFPFFALAHAQHSPTYCPYGAWAWQQSGASPDHLALVHDVVTLVMALGRLLLLRADPRVQLRGAALAKDSGRIRVESDLCMQRERDACISENVRAYGGSFAASARIIPPRSHPPALSSRKLAARTSERLPPCCTTHKGAHNE